MEKEKALAGCIFAYIDDIYLLEKLELGFLKEAKNYQYYEDSCKMLVEIAHQARLRIEYIDDLMKGQ